LGIKLHQKAMNYDEIRQYSLSTAPNNQTYRISVKREGSATWPVYVQFIYTITLNVETKFEAMPPAGDFFF